MVANLVTARGEAEQSLRRSETLTTTLADATTQIGGSVRAIERNSERQRASVKLISELELRAKDIAEITQTVGRIADQTNLLALNAAIEAARAGEHGRGFAVVADEVRALAETSDRHAQEVREVAGAMTGDVQRVVAALSAAAANATKEANSAASVIEALQVTRDDVASVAEGSRQILTSTAEAERAAIEAESGAGQIATAAEEQSTGAGQAQSAVQQQAKSLEQAQIAAQTLAVLAEQLRRGKSADGTSEQIGAASEELSATIQELSSAATEIMAAVEQIDRAAQLQASGTQQTSAALAQIEKTAKFAETSVRDSDSRVREVEKALKTSRAAIDTLVNGVRASLSETQSSASTVFQLGTLGRKVEKMIDAIALISVQTSMLAVSGSVEAARAGESGRGFAIVSNDIRALAREASANVDRAKDTVRGILEQIAVLKGDLEQTGAAAENEVENNRRLATVLDKLGGEVDEMRTANQSIVGRAAEILAATVQAATGARQIAAAAEEAGAASRKAAAAATEQSRGAEDLAAAIEEIALLADELKRADA
jgi:methyl-accepting chemotaxis protein